MSPEVIMIIITAIYVVATIGLCVLSWLTLKESKKQFNSSLELQRQHNYESVRPALTIDCYIGELDEQSGITITVTNHGLGPAVLKELHFTRNDKEYKNINGFCTMYDMFRLRQLEEKDNTRLEGLKTYFCFKEFKNLGDDQSYLAVNKELSFFKLYFSSIDDCKFVEKVFDNVRMELVYTDIFDSCDWKVTKFLGDIALLKEKDKFEANDA